MSLAVNADGRPDTVRVAEPPLPPVIDEDIPCRRCRYNLRGLQRAGLCPECAAPVSDSAGPRMLRYADPAWVSGLAIASRLIVWSIGLTILIFLGFMVILAAAVAMPASSWGWVNLFPIAFLATVLMGLAGQWRMMARDPGEQEHPEQRRTRAVVRAAILTAMPLSLITNVAEQSTGHEPTRVVLDLLAKLALFTFMAGLMAYCLHLRRLSDRIPDERHMRDWLNLFWVLVVLIALFVAAEVIGATLSAMNRLHPAIPTTQSLGGPPGALFIPNRPRPVIDGLAQVALALSFLIGLGTLATLLLFVGAQSRFGKRCREQARLARLNRERLNARQRT